jgi:PmbA protein
MVAHALDTAKRAGADKAQVHLMLTEKSELNVDSGRMSLFRTTGNASLSLTVFVGARKGSATLNKIDASSIEEAAREAAAFASTAEADMANDISPAAPPKEFEYGDREPDREAMYARLSEFVAYAGKAYPKTKLEQCILDFTRYEGFVGNTNGAFFIGRRGLYDFSAMFTSKDGEKTSSFNYSGASDRKLTRPLEAWGSVDELMRQSSEQLEPRRVQENFEGDLIMAPDCMGDLVHALQSVFLGDYPMLAGTSPWKDRLGERVCSDTLTLRSMPVSERIKAGYFVTPDGFEAKDATIIDGGILESFLLGLYASNKTGKPRATTAGGAWIIEAGADSLASMISGIERGLLLCRFSGGNPSSNGDFSGVAKNSYLIEKGKLAYPVVSTMISGNFGDLVQDVKAVSKETVDFGSAIFPWIRFGGVTIAGN